MSTSPSSSSDSDSDEEESSHPRTLSFSFVVRGSDQSLNVKTRNHNLIPDFVPYNHAVTGQQFDEYTTARDIKTFVQNKWMNGDFDGDEDFEDDIPTTIDASKVMLTDVCVLKFPQTTGRNFVELNQSSLNTILEARINKQVSEIKLLVVLVYNTTALKLLQKETKNKATTTKTTTTTKPKPKPKHKKNSKTQNEVIEETKILLAVQMLSSQFVYQVKPEEDDDAVFDP